MPARSPEAGLEEVIRFSGTQFEPEVVEAFVEWWHKKYQAKDPIINSDINQGKIREELLIEPQQRH
jgi:HD-GYP domain-containing protein (c-di-GMP phosphodiesterase class II)